MPKMWEILGEERNIPDRENSVSIGVEARKRWKCTFAVGTAKTKPDSTQHNFITNPSPLRAAAVEKSW